jgi:hypothetical protein
MSLKQLPIFVLVVGILLLIILVACDEDVPGSGDWNTQSPPKVSLPK